MCVKERGIDYHRERVRLVKYNYIPNTQDQMVCPHYLHLYQALVDQLLGVCVCVCGWMCHCVMWTIVAVAEVLVDRVIDKKKNGDIHSDTKTREDTT